MPFDNEESTGFVSDIPQEVVEAIPYGPGMMVKAIFQKVWDFLNRDPKLQEEFGHALRLWKQYRANQNDRRRANAIVQLLIQDLRDRQGLKGQWDGMDTSIKKEIRLEWERIVEKGLS